MKNSCCLCDSDAFEKAYKNVDGYILVRCSQCDLVYLQEYGKTENFLHDTHEIAKTGIKKGSLEFWGFPDLYKKYQSIFDGFFEERWQRLNHYNQNLKSMLDIGCGYGLWLNYCRKKGLIQVEGLDESSAASAWAKENFDLTIHQTKVETFKPEKKYDAVVMCDILEHLREPKKELIHIRDLLNNEGIIMIQVPNVLGFKYPTRPIYSLPYHLWQFKIGNLRQLLSQCGFTLIKYWTGTMGIIGRYEAGGPSRLEKFLWTSANRFKLGNRLIGIAKKDQTGLYLQ